MSRTIESTALDVFRHATADRVEVYRAILSAFVAAKERFALHLRPREVLPVIRESGLDVNEDLLEGMLDQLVAWGNLRSYADTSEVATVEEFHRKRRLFALTREGEAAERALEAFREHLGTPGELNAAALADVEAHLRALLALLSTPALDPDKACQSLDALRSRFTELAEQAQIFVAGLRRAVDLHGVEESVFLAYKERLVDYLRGFVGALTVRSAAIAELLEDIHGQSLERLLRAAASREVEHRLDASSELEAELYEHWSLRWRGLRAWFLPEGGAPSQSQLLRHFALDAIPALLRAISHLHDRRVQRSDRREDFLTIARWFAIGDDAACHRLARAVFGLSPSRHLSVNAETLDAWEEHDATGAMLWTDAPPMRIAPRMRKTGTFTKRGRKEKVIDRSAGKAALAELAAREAQELAVVRARLATEGRLRVGALCSLDRRSLDLFLDLLGTAYAMRGPSDRRLEALSSDGALRIVLELVPEGGEAQVRTSIGTLLVPDAWVFIEDLTRSFSEVAQ